MSAAVPKRRSDAGREWHAADAHRGIRQQRRRPRGRPSGRPQYRPAGQRAGCRGGGERGGATEQQEQQAAGPADVAQRRTLGLRVNFLGMRFVLSAARRSGEPRTRGRRGLSRTLGGGGGRGGSRSGGGSRGGGGRGVGGSGGGGCGGCGGGACACDGRRD
eukprot:scaffold101024_cov52-Phaeocystis_antarctica.AAC.3